MLANNKLQKKRFLAAAVAFSRLSLQVHLQTRHRLLHKTFLDITIFTITTRSLSSVRKAQKSIEIYFLSLKNWSSV